jgi:NAD(P)-dependent dehydrogenase (short-subunit alcohol dehydrogenase family)
VRIFCSTTVDQLPKPQETAEEIRSLGCKAWLFQADLSDLDSAARLPLIVCEKAPIFAIIHNAAIFEPLQLPDVTPESWQHHMNINLGAPFFISQAFFQNLKPDETGRIITMLDWRALRPGIDHLPYTVSKAAIASLTRSMAIIMAPKYCKWNCFVSDFATKRGYLTGKNHPTCPHETLG